MTGPIHYTLYKDGEEHTITITPGNKNFPGGDKFATGVFSLNEGNAGMGEIVFDDHMKQWEYTGMGNLTHEEAARIAGFIQANNQSDANDNTVL
jgi:hypothetical protein